MDTVITLNINNVPTLFIKAFSAVDVQSIIEFVRQSACFYVGSSNTVLFIDTPITAATVESVERLKREGFRVVFRDHHGIDGPPSNDRERQVVAATSRLQQLLGDDCLITVRALHPACSTLVSVGEFKDAIAIIADPDADGLTAAMKSAGIAYDGMDDDAAKLDGPPQMQVTGTPLSQLLAKGVATIPSYDPQKAKEREKSQQQLFSDWMQAVCGNASALKKLETRLACYEEAVSVAEDLARTAKFVAPGVVLVDVAGKDLYDPGTLQARLEERPLCKITVVRKSLGPIAALHNIQYSLSVTKGYQQQIDLQQLIPPDVRSDPEIGIICNVSFLLHTSESVWQEQVLPKLSDDIFAQST